MALEPSAVLWFWLPNEVIPSVSPWCGSKEARLRHMKSDMPPRFALAGRDGRRGDGGSDDRDRPDEASHAAVAIDPAEVGLGELRVRAGDGRLERLLSWARRWPQRRGRWRTPAGWAICSPGS